MSLISKQNIEDLAQVNQKYCVSIFIPTHRAGEKVLKKQDSLALKNQLKAVKHKLANEDLQNDIIEDMLNPVQGLIDDHKFWQRQSDGLALFVAEGIFEIHTLPIYFEAYNYISNSFYLKPLMPMFVGDGDFYLMTLALGAVKLYECSHYGFTELVIKDLIPSDIKDRVGYDYEEKNLQFRTQQADSGQAMFHGQEASSDRKNEIKRYFRAINEGIMTQINDDKIPLLIATQDYLFHIYKEVNSHSNLFSTPISVDLTATTIFDIHELAWENIAPTFDQERKDKIADYSAKAGTGKTSVSINEILPAAYGGKIDTLFCENLADIFGTYQIDNNHVKVTQSESFDNGISLMNSAAIQTFLNGGQVYLLDKEQMPDPNSKVNALLRY